MADRTTPAVFSTGDLIDGVGRDVRRVLRGGSSARAEAPAVDATPSQIQAQRTQRPAPLEENRRADAPAADGPRHVAVIMDGNGRWAGARGMPRLEGHRRGVQAVRRVVEACPDLGIETLTLYAFSTENWGRPPDEVSGLMDLFRRYLSRETDELVRNGVRMTFIGDPAPLDDDIRRLMGAVAERTAGGRRLTVAIAINYGGRAEIAAVAQRLAAAAAAGALDPSEIDETAFGDALDRAGPWGAPPPHPDLVIRTSGEQRLSNFLLWQAAYAELMFVAEAWPDFTPQILRGAVEAFARRDRRFGGVGG
ncbi:MAG: polyprenyl diphosphate synthase [Pseudomonadota bacterium]